MYNTKFRREDGKGAGYWKYERRNPKKHKIMGILEKTDRFLLKTFGPFFTGISAKTSRRMRYLEFILVMTMAIMLLVKSCN